MNAKDDNLIGAEPKPYQKAVSLVNASLEELEEEVAELCDTIGRIKAITVNTFSNTILDQEKADCDVKADCDIFTDNLNVIKQKIDVNMSNIRTIKTILNYIV